MDARDLEPDAEVEVLGTGNGIVGRSIGRRVLVVVALGCSVLVAAPFGAIGVLVLGLWGTFAVSAALLLLLTAVLIWPHRARSLGTVPRPWILVAMGTYVAFVAASIAAVLGFLILIDDSRHSASDVMDDTQLPDGARVVARYDSGTQSASYSDTFFVMPGPIAPDSVSPPTGFSLDPDLERLGAPECHWRTGSCQATRIAIFDGDNADYANGYCSLWLTEQSNTADLNGEQRPVVVASASCSEGMRRRN